MEADFVYPLTQMSHPKSTNLIFGDDHEHNNLMIGLQNYGPWDSNKISRKVRNIYFEILFQDGIKESEINDVCKTIKADHNKFGNFQTAFRLEKITFSNNSDWIKIVSKDDFTNALRDVKNRHPPYLNKTAIVCLFVSRENRNYPPTPLYYDFKLRFLKEGYITQSISLHPESAMSNLSFSGKLYYGRNIQLQIYAKSGGIPWVIAKSKESPEVFLGLGFARMREEPGYAVGALSLFDSNGLWNRLSISSKFDYTSTKRWSPGLFAPKEIVESLYTDVIKEQMSISDNKTLCLHKNGTYSNEEIYSFIDASKKYQMSIAFVEITKTNYMLFHKNQSKFMAPYVNYHIGITYNSALYISTNAHSSKSIGAPVVLKIKLHHKSTWKPKLSSILQQIKDLIRVSWRDLFREDYLLPSTLSYAQKAANMYSRGVNAHDSILDKPWFL